MSLFYAFKTQGFIVELPKKEVNLIAIGMLLFALKFHFKFGNGFAGGKSGC